MFKDSVNRWVTRGIFAETAGQNKDHICMTLEEGRQRFVECGDMLGISFADKYLGGYQHWKAVQNSAALKGHIAEWKEELEVRIRSKELERIAGMAGDGQFQASKFLMDRGWDKRVAGRPSNEEVERQTKVDARVAKEFQGHVSRIKR